MNKFCKNNYLKSEINELVLNVNKIIFEEYVLANLHIIWLHDEGKEVPPLNQKFFQNVAEDKMSLAKMSLKEYYHE